MKAIIMAGGSGKRLRPMTSTTPKPMVRIFAKPVISYIFDLLKSNMFDDVTVTLGYMAERIEDFILNDYHGRIKISSITEETPLGTAGSVRNAAKNFNEPFLVISGDCICDFDLKKAMNFHLSHKADVTIVCAKVSDPREYGVVEFDDNDKVFHFTEKPCWSGAVSDNVNTGIYIINPEILGFIPENKQYDFSKDLFPELMKKGKSILAYVANGYWCDIGNIKAYKECCNDIMDGKVKLSLPQVAEGVFVNTSLPEGKYSIIPPCYIGSDVEIGENAVIGPYSVIDDGCIIGDNSKLQNSYMLPFSVVYNNSIMCDALLCENVVVKSGVRIYEDSVVGAGATINQNSVIGKNVYIWPDKVIEHGSNILKNIKYENTTSDLFGDNGISGTMGVEIDSVTACIIGQALASSSIGKRVGIASDGKPFSKAIMHSVIGGLMSHGSHVWNFGEGFLSQMMYYVSFCGLKSGVFISERNSIISINICGEGGLSLSNNEQRDLENRIKYGEFSRCSSKQCKDVSDMTGVGLMYRRELIRQSETELSDMACSIKCQNEKISLLMEDCLYRLGCKQGDEITFKINSQGTTLSAFHRECGWVSHDKLLSICCDYETQNGRDIAVPFNSPHALDGIAKNNGRNVLRYYNAPTDYADSEARKLACSQVFMRDALFMSVRLLGIMSETGKSLSMLVRSIPEFYVSRKRINLGYLPSELKNVCKQEEYEITKEGILFKYPNGRVLITPSRTGKILSMISEANNYEISKELCDQVENLVKTKKEQDK